MSTRTGLFRQMNEYQPGMIKNKACRNSLIYCSSDQFPKTEDLLPTLEAIIKETHESESSMILQLSKRISTLNDLKDLEELAFGLDVDYLHLDHSWPAEEVRELALRLPVAVSVSNLTLPERYWFRNNCPNVLFIHDYYTRKDTGLDQNVFDDLSEGISREDLVVFVPGNPVEERKGNEPSTLEHHRTMTPYAASLDLMNQGVGGIIYTSFEIGDMEKQMIDKATQGVYGLPVSLNHPELYHQTFTIRSDSPKKLRRLLEIPQGIQMPVNPDVPVARRPGFITMDNLHFPDSQGSLMICNGDFQADPCVNVIGHVCDYYLPIIELLENGACIEFIHPNLHG